MAKPQNKLRNFGIFLTSNWVICAFFKVSNPFRIKIHNRTIHKLGAILTKAHSIEIEKERDIWRIHFFFITLPSNIGIKHISGMKYPIGVQSFERIIKEGFVYIDKTDLIYQLTRGSIFFLSRPRRFGKSLLVSTLENYYLGRKELFEGLKIAELEHDWITYPVFHIDFNSDNFMNANTLQTTIERYVSDWEKQYHVSSDPNLGLGRRFSYVLKAAHEQTGQRCVVLVDEYDKPLLDVMGMPETIRQNNVEITLEENNRNILKGFYSTFKLADNDLQFVLLTGVTKFSQISVFGGFNQPNDISMTPKFDTLCGITDEELETYFHEPMQELADSNGYSYPEIREVLRRQFDGYHFSRRLKGVYNPFSLLNTFAKMDIRDYWFRTGTPTYLIRLLQDYHENLNDLTGKYYDESEFVDYRADREMPLPMIYQSGYLTIKDYDREMQTYLLDFPNTEVKKGFVTMTANSYLGTREDAGSWVRSAVIALKRGELEKFRTLLTSFLASIPYTARRKENETERERYFTYTLYLIFRIASCYITYIEKEQSYGRLDCCVETAHQVYIFEFKLDGSAEAALQQIEEKGYAKEFAASGKTIYKIGVNISSETGTVDGWQMG